MRICSAETGKLALLDNKEAFIFATTEEMPHQSHRTRERKALIVTGDGDFIALSII